MRFVKKNRVITGKNAGAYPPAECVARIIAEYRGRLQDIPFDFHELVGALAPRHVLIIAPLKDSNFRAASVDRVAAAAHEVFKLHGHADRLRLEHPDCDHDFPKEMRQQAYELFDHVMR